MSDMEAAHKLSEDNGVHHGDMDADSRLDDLRQGIQAALAGRVRSVLDDPSMTCAAVLLPLLHTGKEWHVLVTVRTDQVEHHKGQISFPGGACDPDDATLEATALREADEEIGLPPEAVDILGALDDVPTVTGFAVTPFIGIVQHSGPYRLNQHEVAAVVEVPLSFLRQPDKVRVGQVEYKGKLHDVLFWDYGPHVIWGATAQILKTFVDLLE